MGEKTIKPTMKVIIEHPHNCEIVAKALMSEGREWTIGKLTEIIPEFPHEKYCLHLKTNFKDVTFLCNNGDLQQLQLLCRHITGKLSESWIDSIMKMQIPNNLKN